MSTHALIYERQTEVCWLNRSSKSQVGGVFPLFDKWQWPPLLFDKAHQMSTYFGVALVLYRLSDHIKGLIGHSGYEFAAGPFSVWPMPFVCVLHHDAHHELFRYNFGNTLSIWDRLFGTLDPNYDRKVREIRQRLAKRRAYSARSGLRNFAPMSSFTLDTPVLLEWLIPTENLWLKFGLLFLLLYLVHLLMYLGMGYALTKINEKNPGRKVQARHTKVPASVEIKQGFISLSGSALCLMLAVLVQYQGWSLAPVEISLPSLSGIFCLLGFFVLSVILGDIWFYAEHRLAHTPRFIRFHREHHLSPVPTPWTNDRFSFVEVIMIQSYLFVVLFLLPVPVIVLVAHRFYDQVKGMIGHGGYEYFEGRWARWPSPFTCVTHHDAHHEKFSVNYGSFLTIWDRMFGTLEAGYDQKVEWITEQYKTL